MDYGPTAPDINNFGCREIFQHIISKGIYGHHMTTRLTNGGSSALYHQPILLTCLLYLKHAIKVSRVSQ